MPLPLVIIDLAATPGLESGPREQGSDLSGTHLLEHPGRVLIIEPTNQKPFSTCGLSHPQKAPAAVPWTVTDRNLARKGGHCA